MSSTAIQEPIAERSLQSFSQSDDRARARRISAVIRFSEKRLRRRLPWLDFQNLIGAALFLVAATGFIASSALYIHGAIPAWVCVLVNAFLASILHELEHDLIHNIYFNRRPFLQNAMMLGVWVFRGNIINPWHRRKLHLLHHKESGQHTDLEEQLIGNGMRYGWTRWLSMFDGFLGTILRGHELMTIPAYKTSEMLLASLPFIPLFSLCWYSWVGFHVATIAASLVGSAIAWPAWIVAAMPWVNAVIVIYVLPNMIRQASINIISSSMHYFGDVDGIVHQTQVLNRWYFWPLQAFCFNFGSTHGIHHFVVNQPFYLRQMVAAPAHAAMRKYGVRFNDLGTFQRANRYYAAPTSATAAVSNAE